jgi:RNA polymerase sigma factor (sigma-70 family)
MTAQGNGQVRTDADLVRAARSNDPSAFGELFHRWYDRCYDVAWNIVRNREVAADVAQDVFLQSWERLADLRDPDAFGGWILRATRNRALNHLRSERTRSRDPLDELEEGVTMTDPDADPATLSEITDRRRLVWTAAGALGDRDASLLDLHLRHGLEPGEIAQELQITPNNAHQLLFRLRGKLRDAIGAALLWRDGRPTCTHLATLVPDTGAFDGAVASAIRRHQRTCEECTDQIARATHPERLFASVPLAVAPLAFKERAMAALTDAGVPMSSTAPLPGAGSGGTGGTGTAGSGATGGTGALAGGAALAGSGALAGGAADAVRRGSLGPLLVSLALGLLVAVVGVVTLLALGVLGGSDEPVVPVTGTAPVTVPPTDPTGGTTSPATGPVGGGGGGTDGTGPAATTRSATAGPATSSPSAQGSTAPATPSSTTAPGVTIPERTVTSPLVTLRPTRQVIPPPRQVEQPAEEEGPAEVIR